MYLHSETARQAQRQTDLEKSAGRVARERDFLQEMLTKAKKRQEADSKELAQLRLQVYVIHVHIHMYIHMYIHMRMHMHMHMQAYTPDAKELAQLRLQVYVMHVHAYTYTYAYAGININIYMHIYMLCQRPYAPAVSRRASVEP
jgi:hypothetical protein